MKNELLILGFQFKKKFLPPKRDPGNLHLITLKKTYFQRIYRIIHFPRGVRYRFAFPQSSARHVNHFRIFMFVASDDRYATLFKILLVIAGKM